MSSGPHTALAEPVAGAPANGSQPYVPQWQRHAAKSALNRAVREGLIQRPNRCEACLVFWPRHYPIMGHHSDYTKPLDVIWLCSGCHVSLHAIARAFSQAVYRRERLQSCLVCHGVLAGRVGHNHGFLSRSKRAPGICEQTRHFYPPALLALHRNRGQFLNHHDVPLHFDWDLGPEAEEGARRALELRRG